MSRKKVSNEAMAKSPAIPEFTICVTVDRKYLGQFKQVWPTWMRFKPEILQRPLLIICDCQDCLLEWWMDKLDFVSNVHHNVNVIGWDWPNTDDTEYDGMTQRERMLTAWVRVPPACVETPYWMKVDTDSVAVDDRPLAKPEWFKGEPALIASPWPYTKPPDAFRRLNEWAETIPSLAPLEPMELPDPSKCVEVCRYPRIASWICFVDTVWSRAAADLCQTGRLPVPSQDTYHFYLTIRQGDLVRKVRFGKEGWLNRHTNRGRAALIREVMGDFEDGGCCG